MKSKFLLLTLSGLLLASCGGSSTPSSSAIPDSSAPSSSPVDPGSSEAGQSDTSTPTSDPTSESSSSVDPIPEERYAIQVSVPTGIEYTLSSNRAKKGEVVTFTLTKVPTAFTIVSVTLNNVALTGKDGVYNFTMPGRSVTIKVSVEVSGDVTLIGDIAASLVEENGVYAAHGIAVPEGRHAFSYQVKKGDETVVLDSTDLDEYRCFADVTFALGGKFELVIEGGFTYDFFYDPASDYPCYIRRVSVDYLPANAAGLEMLFDGSMRSESTVNYADLKGYTYTVRDKEDSENPIQITADYKVYENNVTYLKATDGFNDEVYHVYKNYDEANNLFTTVDTYSPKMGNNDRTRLEANNHGIYAGTFDVVDVDEDSLTRSQMNPREAAWRASKSAHIGKQLEEELMYAYRVGFSRDELTASKVDVSSVKDGDNIVTTIDSFAEYNSNAGTCTSEMHEAHVFAVTLTFDPTGKPLGVAYTKTRYGKEEWNFVSHKPNAGFPGTKTKIITATYEYGAPNSGSPEFSTAPYFIDEIEDIRFYDPATGMPDDDGKSYLHFHDTIALNKTSDNDKMPYLAAFDYAPATALDFWQYGPTASSDPSVITRRPNDLSYTMTAVNMGVSTVTFGNYTANSGATFDEEITVVATQKFHSIYLYSTWGGMPGDCTTSDSANVTAGEKDNSFYVQVTPSSAPVVYEAQSSNEDLLKIVDANGNPGTGKVACGEKLTLDTTGAKDITVPTPVTVTLTSDWFQPGCGPKTFTFTIIPAAADVRGTNWASEEWGDDVEINFTKEESSKAGYDYVGYVTDHGETSLTHSQVYVTFAYSFSHGQIKSVVTAISFVNDTQGWPKDYHDYEIDFYYDAATDRIGLYLGSWEYDSEIEDYYRDPMFGGLDDEGYPYSYTPFVRVND